MRRRDRMSYTTVGELGRHGGRGILRFWGTTRAGKTRRRRRVEEPKSPRSPGPEGSSRRTGPLRVLERVL
jgi:hypothetical protein